MKSTSIISLILAILSLLIVAVGCYPSSNGSSTTSTSTQVSNQQEVEDLIKNSSTFKFDGITGSIKSVNIVSSMEGTATIPAKDWELAVKYQTSHPGHGDRTGQVLAQVITNHTAVINIENEVITSAICDNIWDMQADKSITHNNDSSPSTTFTQQESKQIAEDFVKKSPTFKFDGIEDTLKFVKADMLRTPFGWQFTFEFQSRHQCRERRNYGGCYGSEMGYDEPENTGGL